MVESGESRLKCSQVSHRCFMVQLFHLPPISHRKIACIRCACVRAIVSIRTPRYTRGSSALVAITTTNFNPSHPQHPVQPATDDKHTGEQEFKVRHYFAPSGCSSESLNNELGRNASTIWNVRPLYSNGGQSGPHFQ